MKKIDEKTIGGRLRVFRVSKHLKIVPFSKLLGISHGSLSDIENNQSKPSSKPIESLVRKTDINIYWLFTGKGEMLRGKDSKEAYQENALDTEFQAVLLCHINAFLSSIRTQETLNKRVATMERQIAKLIKNQHPSDSS